MRIKLESNETTLISITGESFVYVNGLQELEIQASGKRAVIPSGSQVRFPKFTEVSVQNKGNVAVDADVIICEGEFRKLFEGSTISAEITNTVDVSGSRLIIDELPQVQAEIVNKVDVTGSHVVIDELPQIQAEIVNKVDVTGSHVVVDELPQVQAEIVSKVDVTGSHVVVDELPQVKAEIVDKVDVSGSSVVIQSMPKIDAEFSASDISNALTTTYTITANSYISIPQRLGRRRLVIQAYIDSESTAICRISDSSKTVPSGQFLFVGGGLMAEIEHKHSAALKVWNPTSLNGIEVTVLEEF